MSGQPLEVGMANVVPLRPDAAYPVDRDPALQPLAVSPDRKDLYKFSAEQSLSVLEGQASELSNTRTRAVQLIAFLGSATAFLVGTAVRPFGATFGGTGSGVPRDSLYGWMIFVA